MATLTNKEFDHATREALDPVLLSSEGFQFRNGVYWRGLATSLRHLIGLDFEGRRGRFSVMVGCNSAVITGDAAPEDGGFLHVQYLTPGGLGPEARYLGAQDRRRAGESLRRVGTALTSFALPWLANHQDLRSLAHLLGSDFDGVKGKLLLAHGAPAEARPWLTRYLTRLSEMPRDHEVAAAIVETEALLAKC
jgi:hypothetical protein